MSHLPSTRVHSSIERQTKDHVEANLLYQKARSHHLVQKKLTSAEKAELLRKARKNEYIRLQARRDAEALAAQRRQLADQWYATLAEQERVQTEEDNDMNALIRAFHQRLYLYSPGFRDFRIGLNACDLGFTKYLDRVMVVESAYVLWQRKGISTIPPYIKYFDNVTEVNLTQNNLDQLPENLFHMRNLQRLYLAENSLLALPSVGGATQLQVLDLRSNLIKELPADFGKLTKLQTLDLSFNKIRKISGTSFAELVNLDFLSLSNNLIRIVPPQLGHLEKLDLVQLKHNPVTNLPPHIYAQGTVVSLQFLRDVSTAGDIHPSSLVSDLTRLLSSYPVERGFLANHPSNFLCNLILKAGKPVSPAHSMIMTDAPLAIPEDEDDKIFSHPVHDFIVRARSSYIEQIFRAGTDVKGQLPKDEKTNLHVLELPVTPKQLAVIVKHIYTDNYDPPKQAILKIHSDLPQGAKDILAAQNVRLRKAWVDALEHAEEAAQLFEMPYLLKLVKKCHLLPSMTESTLLSDMKGLCNCRAKTGDLTFKIEGHPGIPAHKAILCARSQYFNMMLTGGLSESQSNVVAIDSDPVVFEQIIKFCYLDDVEELDPNTIISLLASANLYGLERLVGIVANAIGYSLDLENVTSILTIAIHYSIKPLAKACYFYLLSNWDAVIRSQGWRELAPELRDKATARAIKWQVKES